MPDYLAKIRAKGLDTTGVTEDLAKTLYSSLGSHGLAIVEWRVDGRKETAEGSHVAELDLTQVEPSTVGFLNDHLRELMRALYRNRALAPGEDRLPGTDNGPSLIDVVGAGEAVMVRGEDGTADRIWDGNTDDAGEGLSCAFPGCHLGYDHDGDHDVFAPVAETSAPAEPDVPADENAREDADLPRLGEGVLKAVPDPFAPAK